MVHQFYRMAPAAALVACFVSVAAGREPHAPVAVTGGQRIMGVPWKIKVFAPDHGAGDAALAAALAEVERLDKVLSDYDPTSELFQLSAAAPMPEPRSVSDDLWNVLIAADTFRESSGGAFDITVGPLTTLWRQARRTGQLPRPAKLAAARAAVGPEGVEFDHDTRRVRLTKPGMRLDAGGIGMGYAADRAMDVLKARGITAAMVDVSGDILVSDAPPGTDGWRIFVAPLRPGGDGETITLVGAAVTTSGDAFQAVEIEGVRYSHIVDPRTGLGVRGPMAVTVVAPTATAADVLATAANVVGPTEGATFVQKFPDTSARFVWREGRDIKMLATPEWPRASETTPLPSP